MTTYIQDTPRPELRDGLLPDVNTLVRFVHQAPKGSRRVYHRGFLSKDRYAAPEGRHVAKDSVLWPRVVIDLKAKAALHFAETGEAILTQRRVGVCEFDYLITVAW